jgi:hypothetical protein
MRVTSSLEDICNQVVDTCLIKVTWQMIFSSLLRINIVLKHWK